MGARTVAGYDILATSCLNRIARKWFIQFVLLVRS
jgi:hypothetical protein